MSRLVSLTFSLSALLTLGCAAEPPKADPAAELASARQAIDAANTRFLEALNKADTARLADNYAADAIVMMPNEPAMRGRENAKKGLQAMVGAYNVTGGAKTEDLLLSGDLAVETGSYDWTMRPRRGKPINDKGKYMTTWQRQADGSWKIVRDMMNSDLPAQ
jgi:uncharacterized protein (TIGR02246 family)